MRWIYPIKLVELDFKSKFLILVCFNNVRLDCFCDVRLFTNLFISSVRDCIVLSFYGPLHKNLVSVIIRKVEIVRQPKTNVGKCKLKPAVIVEIHDRFTFAVDSKWR